MAQKKDQAKKTETKKVENKKVVPAETNKKVEKKAEAAKKSQKPPSAKLTAIQADDLDKLDKLDQPEKIMIKKGDKMMIQTDKRTSADDTDNILVENAGAEQKPSKSTTKGQKADDY